MKPNFLSYLAQFFTAVLLFVSVANAETQSVTFSIDERRSSAFGLDLEYVGQFNETENVEISVQCLAEEGTPELTLNSSSEPSSEKLINTTSSSFGCASFKISTNEEDPSAVGFVNFGIAVDGIAAQSHGAGRWAPAS